MDASSPQFEFIVNFRKGEGAASRVLLAANDFVQACERLDAELVKSIHSGIQAEVVLDDIQSGSLKLILRNVLHAVDDEALRALDWKKAVGAFLLKAKYQVLVWADDQEAPRKLTEVRRAIQTAAAETEVRQLPDYAPPTPAALIRALEDLQSVKNRLIAGDHASYKSPFGDHELDQAVTFTPEQIEQLAVRETITQPVASMILAVKRPDYLGRAQWDLRHGKRTLQVTIADEAWLKQFQSRQVDVRPGDALKCQVEIELLYGFDNELIGEHYRVTQVQEVLRDELHQSDLPLGPA